MLMLTTALLFGLKIGEAVDKQTLQELGLIEDKVYVVSFFASWCSSCKKELPILCQLHEQSETYNFSIVGIDVDKDINKAKSFQSSIRNGEGINFRVINDPKNKLINTFDPIGMPALYFIKDGKVIDVIFGAVDDIDIKILEKVSQ